MPRHDAGQAVRQSWFLLMIAKDIVSKHLLKRIALDMARLLLGLDVTVLDVVESDHQRVEERRADLVVKVRDGEGEYLLHIEIQNDNQRIMPWRMLRYRTDIGFAHPKMTVRQYLLYIGKAPLTMASGIHAPGLDYHYQVVNMHAIDCESLFAQDTPDALVMAILCDFHGRSEREVVRRILRRLLALTGENESAFRDYLLMLEVLSTNRDLKQVVQEEEAMLSQVKYSDLPSFGLGMQQGEALMLLQLLECKFGVLQDKVRSRVQGASGEDLLRWSKQVLSADSIDAVFGDMR